VAGFGRRVHAARPIISGTFSVGPEALKVGVPSRGHDHLLGARQVRPDAVREPDGGGAALRLRAVRRWCARLPRERVRQGGDAGVRALHHEALQVEARRRLRPQLHQSPDSRCLTHLRACSSTSSPFRNE
jgi:hypothetical protein